MMAGSRKLPRSKASNRASDKASSKSLTGAKTNGPGSQDDTGYGRPPKRNQWPKGQSGNPSGRKKGTKNRRTVIIELMEQKLGRKIDDVSKLTRYEGMLLKGIQKALGGDTKAMAFILRRYDDADAIRSRIEPIPSEQDEAVYAAFVEKIKREIAESKQ